MPETSWALVDGPAAPRATLADALVDAARHGRAVEHGDLLERWGAFVRSSPPAVAHVATADNLMVESDGTLGLVHEARAGVDALDADAPARAARVCLHLARLLVRRGAVDDATLIIDALAERLGGQADLPFDALAAERARAHDALGRAATEQLDAAALRTEREARDRWTILDALAAGEVDAADQQAALAAALTSLAVARAERDRAEAAVVELAATRALAHSLGEELERDEWIRARLRNAKSTLPARALIAARKRLR
jgi:hypothetical protein